MALIPLYRCTKRPATGAQFPWDFVLEDHAFVPDDLASHPSIAGHRWSYKPPSRTNRTAYGVRHTQIDGVTKTIFLHDVVYELALGPIPAGKSIDHWNRDGLDNSPANLRPATKAEQQANKAAHRDTESGYKGVCRDKRPGKPNPWRAHVKPTWGDRPVALGSFPTRGEAAFAFNVAAPIAHGAFAFLNQIRPDEIPTLERQERIRTQVLARLGVTV